MSGRSKFLLILVVVGCAIAFVGTTLQSFMSVDRTESTKDLPTLRVLTYKSFGSSLGAGASLAKAFRKTCNCKIELVTTPEAGTLIQRLNLKKDESFDVVVGFDQTTVGELNPRDWERISTSDVSFDPRIKGQVHDTFVPYDWSPMAFIYKDSTLDQETAKQGLQALTDKSLKESIALQDPRTSSPGLQLLFWSFLKNSSSPLEFYQSLQANIKTIAPSWSASYGLFQKGQAKVAFSYLSSLAYHWGEENDRSYQAIIEPQGHPAQVEFSGVPAKCKNCQLGKNFARFLLTKPAQDYMMKKNFMFPVIQSSLKGTIFEELPQVQVIGNDKVKSFVQQKTQLLEDWKGVFL